MDKRGGCFRKAMVLGSAVFLCLLVPDRISAGSLNGNEAGVMGVLSGTFEFNGKSYTAATSYLAEAESYLEQDDVELSAEDADEVIRLAYANVEQAVNDGYLVELPESGTQTADEAKNAGTGKTDTGIRKEPQLGTHNDSQTKADSGAGVIPGMEAEKKYILKNTGFYTGNGILAAGILFSLLAATVFVTCRYCLFAHYEE